ncbi:caspase family protein [uncultured Dokdonia sp.]|uniref:caspase family protein n=1 Tax=uncultured Dokdonia sp. TaxID=575653 RepID=UPI0026028EAB|nr:caspase family protein [uncultured Dokdonia sp.]
MKRALLVGINDYPKNPLKGCVPDVLRMQEVLATHENGDENFNCSLLISSEEVVTRPLLRSSIEKLFNHDKGTALLYFSGHGATTVSGTFLVTQDREKNDVGISLHEIITMANDSKADEVVIILDCCYAGGAGNVISIKDRKAVLREGVSILAAAGDKQYSYEINKKGVFTNIIYEAMKGAAADLRGKVTLSGMYYSADTILNAWKQRPVFKSHVSSMISLRNCKPKIPLDILRKLPAYFSGQKIGIRLSPNFLKEEHALSKMMEHLLHYNTNGLLMPVGASSLQEAAKQGKECQLTALGQFYKELASKNRLT